MGNRKCSTEVEAPWGKTQSSCPCLHPEQLPLEPEGLGSLIVGHRWQKPQQAHSPWALPASLGQQQVDGQTGPENGHCAFLG